MKYPFKSLLLAATVLAAASCAKDDTQSGGEETAGPVIVNASPAAIGGEIILKLKTEASGIVEKSRAQGVSKGSGIDEIDRILNTVNTVRFERLFPDGGRFEERTRREGLHLWYYAKYDPSVPTSEMASLLSSCKDIEIIEYSLAAETSDHRRAASPAAGAQSVTRAIADEVRNVPFPFNESERSQQMQWHYNNTGNIFAQTSQLGADANVYAAWQLSTGNPDVIVAVVDQGVKYDHEDLAANMWVNEAELNGTPGVDDDGNGYVDDIYGYNFTKETGELDFSAELMHGTHVAGTIAAVNNNGVGVCGIAGGSGRGDGVKIMSCEILGKSESGSSGAGLAGQIRAIKYAADNGAVICQNSWGYTAGTISVTDWTRGSYSALSRAMEYFNKYAGLDENGNQTGPMAGGIVLFAAGNDASSEVCYPAADANAISVGATAFTGAPAYYTNYGTWVRISAPGGDQMLSNAYGGVYSRQLRHHEDQHGRSRVVRSRSLDQRQLRPDAQHRGRRHEGHRHRNGALRDFQTERPGERQHGQLSGRDRRVRTRPQGGVPPLHQRKRLCHPLHRGERRNARNHVRLHGDGDQHGRRQSHQMGFGDHQRGSGRRPGEGAGRNPNGRTAPVARRETHRQPREVHLPDGERPAARRSETRRRPLDHHSQHAQHQIRVHL